MRKKLFSGLGIYCLCYIIFLYAPVLFIPLFSFNNSIFIAFPLRGFTLSWYSQLLQDVSLHEALVNSLIVAVIASLTSTIAGTFTTFTLIRRRSGFARLLTPGALIPLAIPGVMLGLGLLIVANAVGLGPSLTALLIAHITITLPLTIVIMRGRFGSYSASIEESASDLGASEWQIFRKISLPIVWPGILSCLILAFTTSFDEFIVSNFVVGTQQTLPIYIWSNLRYVDQLPKILALGSVILVVSTALVICADILQRYNATTDTQA